MQSMHAAEAATWYTPHCHLTSLALEGYAASAGQCSPPGATQSQWIGYDYCDVAECSSLCPPPAFWPTTVSCPEYDLYQDSTCIDGQWEQTGTHSEYARSVGCSCPP